MNPIFPAVTAALIADQTKNRPQVTAAAIASYDTVRGPQVKFECGPQVQARTVVVYITDRSLLPSQSASQRGADESDSFREEPTSDECDDLCRGSIEPLRVLDDAEQRLLLCGLSEQRERGQPNEEPVRCGAGAQPENGGECVALRGRQPLELIEHRCAQLLETAERELHLRLHPSRRRDAPAPAADLVGGICE